MQVKILISKKARRRVIGVHALCGLSLAVYALVATSGWTMWFLLFVAVETTTATAVYSLVVTPARPVRGQTPGRRGSSRFPDLDPDPGEQGDKPSTGRRRTTQAGRAQTGTRTTSGRTRQSRSRTWAETTGAESTGTTGTAGTGS